MVAEELLDVLVCPIDKTKLEAVDSGLKCLKCKKVYPVREGIPYLSSLSS